MLIAALLLTSCSSSDEDEKVSTGGFSDKPVSGVVYNKKFTVAGTGVAGALKSNGEDTFYIHLSDIATNCDSDTSKAPLWLIVPATVGTHNSLDGAHMQFRDVANDGFEGSSATIEIISITSTTVKGRVMSDSFNDDKNSINGTFTAQLCE